MKIRGFLLRALSPFVLATSALSVPALAADDDKVPYWASIDATIANLRVGPGESYRIDWVYRRPRLPVKVIRREGPWRLIEDPHGDRGWMRDLLLSRQRTATVKGEALVDMHAQGNGSSPMLWRLEPGVIGLLGDCQGGWCPFDVEGHKGFVREGEVWGAGTP